MNIAFSCLVGLAERFPEGHKTLCGARVPAQQRPDYPFFASGVELPTAAGSGQMPKGTGSGGGRLPRSPAEGETGQVGPAAGAGLVPDPIEVRANGADAYEELFGDLAVSETLGDERDQFVLAFGQVGMPGARCRWLAKGCRAGPYE